MNTGNGNHHQGLTRPVTATAETQRKLLEPDERCKTRINGTHGIFEVFTPPSQEINANGGFSAIVMNMPIN